MPVPLPVLYIAQAPGVPGPHARNTRADARLSRFLNIALADLPCYLRWINVLSAFPGKSGKGDRFPLAEARQCAAKICLEPVTLLAGSNVARAFQLSPALFTWNDVQGCRVAVVPHPSGINRWWNDPAHVAQFRAFCCSLLGLSRYPRRLCSLRDETHSVLVHALLNSDAAFQP